jgi:hypothetical protein
MHPARQKPQIDVFPSYKGGHTTLYGRYIFEFCPTHPHCNVWGFVAQHRLIAEDKMGRLLVRGECVHHDDEVPTNNHPDNLIVMTKSEHHRHHMRKIQGARLAALDPVQVEQALQELSLKNAAALLGVHTQTLRNRFPDLVAPHKRKTPTQVDDPEIIALIRELAPDPMIGYRQIALRFGIAAMTVKRICERENIPWTKKTRKGEKRRPYRRRNASPSVSASDGSATALVLPGIDLPRHIPPPEHTPPAVAATPM